MDPSLQIRQLPQSITRELAIILDINDSWKTLMKIIPMCLSRDTYRCDITQGNRVKYTTEHFHIIEDASVEEKLSPSVILLDEWGTSGKVLPTVGHLQYLLKKAQLLRASHYVGELLGEAPKVLYQIDAPAQNNAEFEKFLHEMHYPSSTLANLNNIQTPSTNKNYTNSTNAIPILPKIVVNEGITNELLVRAHDDSDMMKFSSENCSCDVVIPQISSLLEGSVSNRTVQESQISTEYSSEQLMHSSNSYNGVIPKLDSLLEKSRSTTQKRKSVHFSDESAPGSPLSTSDLPDVSLLRSNKSETDQVVIPQLSTLLNVDDDESDLSSKSHSSRSVQESGTTQDAVEQQLPQLSALGLDESGQLSQASSFQNVPDLGRLLSSALNITELSSTVSSANQSRKCTSPLPVLSLKTSLPHFTYGQLETATAGFEETPLANGGRFLGSGAFGQVFLGRDLIEKPVAIKKLRLDNALLVKADDAVTKQFRNEVEILSRYQHENLLSLLGYSCDGCTYCLVYDYVAGGALKDRLAASIGSKQQKDTDRLVWTERLYVAMGTAKAIAYLHTAFETPLIHRDVKSANILLDPTNKPKLGDFGLIKLTPNYNTVTSTNVIGTNAYMAPEAFRGDVSVKVDTFSFGVVLLELLTSLPPLDENREGIDLITHVSEVCNGDIKLLLDTSVGSWIANGQHFGEKLYQIANLCLQDQKRSRPPMVEIAKKLTDLINNQ